MVLSDRQRHEAYEALTAAFADQTDLIIEMLRPAHDLATKADVEMARRDLSEEISAVRDDLSEDIAAVRQDIAAVRHDLGEDIASLRHDLSEDIAAVRHDLGGEIASLRHGSDSLRGEVAAMETRLTLAFERHVHEAFAAQTRTIVLGLVGAFVLTALTNILTVALG